MSIFQTEQYTDDNGNKHFGDTYVGSSLLYGIKWVDWLADETNTFTAMVWDTAPTGLTYSNTSDAAGISYVNIAAATAGCYRISGIMESDKAGLQQFKKVEVYLKVFDPGSC